MSSKFRSFLFLASVYTAFFVSGTSSLIAEVTWNRMLVVVVGNTMSATAMILVLFMGGLGLGSFAGGKIFGKRSQSLMPYVLLEIALGIYIILSPVLFNLLAGAFSSLAETFSNRSGLTLVRLAVSLVALFVPAFMMGATFPAMIAGTSSDSILKRTGRIGFLYSINTLGAAAGAFFAGYYLLSEYGVQTTLAVAFCLNIIAALCAFIANTAGRSLTVDAAETPQLHAEATPADSVLRIYLGTSVFLIGFAALAYQVLLTRLGILYVGNGLSVFPRVLTAFLLGTALSAILGTWFYGFLHGRTKHSSRLFGLVALTGGALVLGTPYLLVEVGGWGAVDYLGRRLPFILINIAIIVVPTIMIGALLPIAIRMFHSGDRGEATREAANLYALNTAGGVIGAGLANHVFVPVIGLQGAIILLAVICSGIGFFSLLTSAKRLPRLFVPVFSTILLATFLYLTVPNLMVRYNEKIAESAGVPSAEVLLAHEGRVANVTVFDIDYFQLQYRDMFLNGIEEASTRYDHTQLFKLLGILPAMLHEVNKPKEALVIAFGAGITAGSVLASDEVISLDVVDLNPDIEAINNLFTDVNGDVFHQPRFNFYNDDGRNYLVTSAKKYDLIISDSTHPHAYDSWILYTKEFYESVKKRLYSRGIFAQWVPLDPNFMQGQLFRVHLNTFRSVFPNSTFWYVPGSCQAFLVASPEPLKINALALQQKMDRLPEWFRAKHYEIDTVARISSFFWLDGPAISRMIGAESRINTDNLHYFDRTADLRPLPGRQQPQAYQANFLPLLDGASEKVRVEAAQEQTIAQAVAKYYFLRSLDDLIYAYCMNPHKGIVNYLTAGEYTDGLPDYATVCGKPAP